MGHIMIIIMTTQTMMMMLITRWVCSRRVEWLESDAANALPHPPSWFSPVSRSSSSPYTYSTLTLIWWNRFSSFQMDQAMIIRWGDISEENFIPVNHDGDTDAGDENGKEHSLSIIVDRGKTTMIVITWLLDNQVTVELKRRMPLWKSSKFDAAENHLCSYFLTFYQVFETLFRCRFFVTLPLWVSKWVSRSFELEAFQLLYIRQNT